MDEFYTWGTLGTMAGAVGAVTLLTQFIKWLTGDKLSGWVARAVSFVCALVIVAGAALVTGGLQPSGVVLVVLNAVLVTLAANGLFDNITDVAKEK